MGYTIDGKTGRRFFSCDSCGAEITGGRMRVDPPSEVRGWPRYAHISYEICERVLKERGLWVPKE